MLVPPMYETLERRSVSRFRTVVYTSFGFLFLLFTGFQTVALSTFGPNVPQDVLSILPGDALGNAVRYGRLGVFASLFTVLGFRVIFRLAFWRVITSG